MQQVPGCCCVSAGSSEAAGMGQQCQRVAKGPSPSRPRAGRVSWHPSVCPDCCPHSVPGERHWNPSSVSWLLLKDLGELSGPRQAGTLFCGQFPLLSGRVPQRALRDGVSAAAALLLAQQLPCAWAEPLGVSVGLMCCIVCPAAKIRAWSFEEAALECCSVPGSLGLLREGCQAWPWMLSTILGLAGACLVQVPAALGELLEHSKSPSTFLAASPGLAGSPGIPWASSCWACSHLHCSSIPKRSLPGPDPSGA